jgi:triacylglycerol esterase/lipase EstA (alpha/beta hydrolase family)
MKAFSAAAALRLLLVGQGAAVLLLAFGLSSRGWKPAAAIAAAFATLLLVRALIFTNNFRMSARAASAVPPGCRLGLAGWLRLWGEEFAASMLQSSWYTPCGAARQVIFDDTTAVPVLLLHGYGCNSGFWQQLGARLTAARITHATVDLAPVTGDIDGYSAQVAAAADALLAASGAAQLNIVAHSMGGLVARAWLRNDPHALARTARLITLGSPHHGTVLANLGVGANARQMRRSQAGEPSEWLRALAAGESAAARARMVSIWTCHDNIVAPQQSSCLDGAVNIALWGVGHVALGSNRRVLDCVLAQLQSGSRVDNGTPQQVC